MSQFFIWFIVVIDLVCRDLRYLLLHDLRVLCVLYSRPVTEFVVPFEMLSLIGLISVPVVILLGKFFLTFLRVKRVSNGSVSYGWPFLLVS